MAVAAQSARHARHLALPQLGESGQRLIGQGTALLIGVGGIGCAAASYLACSGVGRLKLCDFDTVDATNLGRQILFGPDDIGKPKAELAARRLRAINPDIRISAIGMRLEHEDLLTAVSGADIVLDGSDNFATRFAVSDACVAAGRTLVSGAAIRLEGQLAVFGPDYDESPCYRCLYQEADESLESCAGNGVLAPVPGAIGALMAAEALKALSGIGATRGMLQLYDASSSDLRSVRIEKNRQCEACAA
jgi:adenylyltransferase/sulfurtransferase